MAIWEYQEVLCDTCPESNPTFERRPVGAQGLPDGWTVSYQGVKGVPDSWTGNLQGVEVTGQVPPPAWLEHCPRCSERVADARRRREAPGRKAKAEVPV